MTVADAFIFTGLALLAMAAVQDVASRTVPNRVALGVAACGLAAQAVPGVAGSAAGAGWAAGMAVMAALAVFAVATALWRFGCMGGADVKLLSAATLLVPASSAPGLMGAIALSGGALALPYLAARRRLGRPCGRAPQGVVRRMLRVERWRLSRGGPLPYAVAIAMGTFLTLTSVQDIIP